MKIAVVGAGIVGVCTAFELATDGHEVTVYERRSAAAEETSFANAGVVAPGYVTPWAAPGMIAKVFKGMLGRHAAIRVRMPFGLRELAWMSIWYGACNPEAYKINRGRSQRLAFFSRARLHEIAKQLGIEYERAPGYLVLLRGENERRLAQPGLALLSEAGVRHEWLDADAARRIDPALDSGQPLAGAIHLPDDEVGNCRHFALSLKREAERCGARFVFGNAVALGPQSTPARLMVAGVETPHDAVVVCAGADSVGLLAPLGVRIPLIPVYGYSVTASIRDPLRAPASGVMDERYKVAISRIGQRIRVAGSAEIGGRADALHPRALATLYKVLNDWYPGCARLDQGVQVWKGARPMLPDGPPLIGASGVAGLWLNLGHGSSGWALACGSARTLASAIAGRNDLPIDASDYDLQRRYA